MEVARPSRSGPESVEINGLSMEIFLPLLMMAGVIFGAFAFALFLNRLLEPQKDRITAIRNTIFECGNISTDQGERRHHLGFYLLAIDFVLFDVELAFFYPWAVAFSRLGQQAMIFISVFFIILAIGFIYAWKSGAIELE